MPVFEANSASPTHTAPPVVAEPADAAASNFRLEIAISALAVAAVIVAALAWRALASGERSSPAAPLGFMY